MNGVSGVIAGRIESSTRDHGITDGAGGIGVQRQTNKKPGAEDPAGLWFVIVPSCGATDGGSVSFGSHP